MSSLNPGDGDNSISREATTGTLKRLKSWQQRAHSTSSKLKRSETKPSSIARTINPSELVKGAANGLRAPRTLAHAALLGGALLVVTTGASAHQQPLRLAVASPSQQAATAGVAANVAQKAGLLVQQDVTTSAKALTSRIAMPTSSEDTLAPQQVVATSGQASRDVKTYTVAAGDTLSSIAAKFNVTTDTVRWANDLSDDQAIKPGLALTILPISGVRYTVAAGDTPESIANHFNSNSAQILSFNDAELAGLKPGMTIVVPDGVVPSATATSTGTQLAAAATTGGASAGQSGAAPVVRASVGGPNTYAYGYCTYYVASRRSIPNNWGDARNWYYSAAASGFGVGSAPAVGAVAWTGSGYYGHVAYVESVSGGNVTVSEMNFNGNWGRVTSRTVPASTFLYIY